MISMSGELEGVKLKNDIMTKTIVIEDKPDKRYGASEPTKSFILPYTETKGDEAIKLYNEGKYEMEPWQGALLCSIMGLDDEGLWVHQKFGYSIPRRNGKTELVIARCLWGLAHGEHILYTAHKTSTAHAIFERLEELCVNAKIPIKKPFRAFGREHIYAEAGGRIEFRTRTTTGGMGEGYDLLILDECQEYTITQAAALKYVITASQNPQTIMLGTPPTPTSAGTVFPNYRQKCLAGQAKYSGWAEWSVEYQATMDDLDALYQTNPSLGHHLTLRAIESEDDGESEVDLAIQRFGYWFKYSLKSVISKPDWENCELKELPEMEGKLFVGIKFGKGSGNVSMAVAKKIKDSDKIFTEVIDCRPVRGGYKWILDFVKAADIQEIAIDGDNGKSSLNDQICQIIDDENLDLDYPTIPKTQEIIKGNSLFEQGILNQTMLHMDQPSLTQVVTNTEKRAIGTNGGFGYKSQDDRMDISLVDAVMLAHWICHDAPDEEYEQFFDY